MVILGRIEGRFTEAANDAGAWEQVMVGSPAIFPEASRANASDEMPSTPAHVAALAGGQKTPV